MDNFMESVRKNRTLLIILAILILVFLMAVQGMSTKDWVVTLLRSLSVGAVTFLVASGFSIILGLMDVLNLAHGVLFMIGAYVGWSVYVRPGAFIDLITPTALLASGFLLAPLWNRLLDRGKFSPQVRRIWPWAGMLVGGILLVFLLPRVPVSMWDPEEYSESPIIWVQQFEGGTLSERLEPAVFEDISPAVGLGA